jgi:hypothetical protein
MFYPPWCQRPLRERIGYVTGWGARWKPERIPLILSPDERKRISLYREQLVPFIATCCARTIYSFPEELSGYHVLLVRVLHGFSHPFTRPSAYNHQQSLLVSFLRSWTKGIWEDHYGRLQEGRQHRKMVSGRKYTPVQVLIRAIHETGLDLQQFGDEEASLLARRLVDQDMRSSLFLPPEHPRLSEFDNVTIRLVGFSYGPSPEDWHGWFSNFRDEYAGEFWEMVANEEPSVRMPGSWVD